MSYIDKTSTGNNHLRKTPADILPTPSYKELRKQRLTSEADPLYMNWQKEVVRGTLSATQLTALKQLWLDKVKQIETEIPVV